MGCADKGGQIISQPHLSFQGEADAADMFAQKMTACARA